MHTRLIAAAVCLSVGAAAFGQSGRYFLTDESGINQIWQFQGGSLVNTFPTVPAGPRHGPIVVDGNTNTVRTVAGGFVGGSPPQPGSEYTFAGVPITPVALDFSAHGGYGRVIDAGFDGQNSYIVAGLGGAAGVFRYNADFSGPGALMFNIAGPEAATAQGITYDIATNTIWTSDYDFSATVTGGRVRQWSLAGVELFSFPVIDPAGNASERNTALAYDPSDDTFWMNAHVETTMGFGLGELWQFDRAGNFLQKIHGASTGGPNDILYWGGEIYTIPAPASAALLAAGGLLMARRRR